MYVLLLYMFVGVCACMYIHIVRMCAIFLLVDYAFCERVSCVPDQRPDPVSRPLRAQFREHIISTPVPMSCVPLLLYLTFKHTHTHTHTVEACQVPPSNTTISTATERYMTISSARARIKDN